MSSQRYVVIPEQDALASLIVAELQAALPSWTPDDSDPGIYWADTTAARIIEMLNQVVDSADANWIETATGDALTELVNNVALTRALGETDSRLRARYYEAWNALAKDTPEFALQLARQADEDVAEVSLDFVADSNVITVYAITADGANLDTTAQTAIEDYMNDPSRHPIWLEYSTADATLLRYQIRGTIRFRQTNPNGDVRTSILAAIATQLRLGVTANTYVYEQAADLPTVVDADLAFHAEDPLNPGEFLSTGAVVELAASADTAYLISVSNVVFTGPSDGLYFVEVV